jgi:hypothetical protein
MPYHQPRIKRDIIKLITSDSDRGQSNYVSHCTGTQRNLFVAGRRPHAPSPHTAQTRELPKSRYSSLSRETSYLSPMPVSICGCNHPLFLCGIIVNDNGSLVGGRLLGLAKLGIGLWFGRTFFVLLEEGRFYSTGF